MEQIWGVGCNKFKEAQTRENKKKRKTWFLNAPCEICLIQLLLENALLYTELYVVVVQHVVVVLLVSTVLWMLLL